MIEEDTAAAADLGVTLPLSTEVADRLRNHQPQTQPQQQKPTKLSFLTKKSSPNDSDSDDELSETEEYFEHKQAGNAGLLLSGADPLDDWSDVLPVAAEGGEIAAEEEEEANEEETNKENAENAADNNDNDQDNDHDDEDDDDDVSLSPPPNMPVVVVDLKRLVGHVPSSPDEWQQLEHQIHAALWYGSSEAAASKEGGNPQEDNMQQLLVAAQHFDKRVTELMDNGVARHSTTATASSDDDEEDHRNQETATTTTTATQEQKPKQHLRIAYPDFLCSATTTTNDEDDTAYHPRQVMATSHIWKRLLRPHPIPVVASLLQHLQSCHRSLVWKHAMHQELWALAKSEEQACTRQHQTQALRNWKTVQRSHQLEQLYQVRETLEHRWEMAKTKVKELKAVRDQAVAQEIRRRRSDAATGFSGGLEAFDLNSTILAFPDANDTTWLGLEDDDDKAYEDDQVGPSFVSDDSDNHDVDDGYNSGESDGSGYAAERDAEEDDHVHGDNDKPSSSIAASNTTGIDSQPPMPALPKRDTKARREALAKKRRRRLLEAAKEAEHQSKLDQARSEEVRMREMFTSNDLKMSQAIAAAVEQKLESVDELLESLQEETWEDEEAQESGKPLVPDDDMVGATTEEFTLLDQVLAMILGAFPPPPPSNGEDAADVLAKHTQELQKEHSRIVKEWRAHFGRLPSSLVTETPAGPKDHPDEEPSQVALRSTYGIVENEEDDWDKADSDDEEPSGNLAVSVGPSREQRGESQPPAEAPAPPPRPARVGLRPGGRIQ